MTINSDVSLLIAGFFVLFSGCKLDGQDSGNSDKPNILFIMSDDHASAAISAYGSTIIQTPHIDRIAEKGILFENAFVVSSLCAPSRASILNGQYGAKSGFKRIGDVFEGTGNTLPNELHKTGYATAILGKWHLKSIPLGFDFFEVVKDQGRFFDPELFSDSTEWNTNKGHIIQGYFANIITDRAIQWLKEHSDSIPFALFVHYKSPHAPHITPREYDSLFQEDLTKPETFEDDFKDNQFILRTHQLPYSKLQYAYEFDVYNSRDAMNAPEHIKRGTPEYKEWAYQTMYKGYYRQIKNMDDNIGRLLNFLDETGKSQNTVIIYTSDNGWFLGDHGLFNKMWMYDESIKVPLIIRYDGFSCKSCRVSNFVSNIDFAPTILDLAGIDIPSAMQGKSFKNLIKGNTELEWKNIFYYHYYDQFGVPEHFGIRTDKYKVIAISDSSGIQYELYDLKSDSDELKNVIDNPDYGEIKDTLLEKLEMEKNNYEN